MKDYLSVLFHEFYEKDVKLGGSWTRVERSFIGGRKFIIYVTQYNSAMQELQIQSVSISLATACLLYWQIMFLP